MRGRIIKRYDDSSGRASEANNSKDGTNPYQKFSYPPRPERPVVQFNSTYMELVDMWDFIRGDVVWSHLIIALVAIFAIGVVDYSMLLEFHKNGLSVDIVFYVVATIILFGLIYALVRRLSRELFSYTYFPVRFNRKEGKVYVMGTNKKVEAYDWASLKVQMQIATNTPRDIRHCDGDDKGTIQYIFSLPIHYLDVNEALYGHFEFVNRYMSATNDSELAEVASSIDHILPIHQRKETLKESMQRSLFDYYYRFMNVEYPKKSIKFDLLFVVNIPFWFLKLWGRRLSLLTSTTPHFSTEIENECEVGFNDKFDLNKNPLIPDFIEPATLLERAFYFVMIMIAMLASLSILAIITDVIIEVLPHGDYPSFFKILWDWLLFRWI